MKGIRTMKQYKLSSLSYDFSLVTNTADIFFNKRFGKRDGGTLSQSVSPLVRLLVKL